MSRYFMQSTRLGWAERMMMDPSRSPTDHNDTQSPRQKRPCDKSAKPIHSGQKMPEDSVWPERCRFRLRPLGDDRLPRSPAEHPSCHRGIAAPLCTGRSTPLWEGTRPPVLGRRCPEDRLLAAGFPMWLRAVPENPQATARRCPLPAAHPPRPLSFVSS